MNEFGLIPSAYGFRSIVPKTRKQRVEARDKVALERSRLDARVGFEARMHQANAPATTAGLTQFVKGGAGWMSNADRFHTDTAGEEKLERLKKLNKDLEAREYRRNKAIVREETRWKKYDDEVTKEQIREQSMRETGLKAKKNKSNVAYDITTTQYNQDVQGVKQKYADDMVRYRAKVRTYTLSKQADTRVDYNILTGASRNIPSYPAQVPLPEDMVEYVSSVPQSSRSGSQMQISLDANSVNSSGPLPMGSGRGTASDQRRY